MSRNEQRASRSTSGSFSSFCSSPSDIDLLAQGGKSSISGRVTDQVRRRAPGRPGFSLAAKGVVVVSNIQGQFFIWTNAILEATR